MSANLSGSRADYDEAVASYNDALLHALQDVAQVATSERALSEQLVHAQAARDEAAVAYQAGHRQLPRSSAEPEPLAAHEQRRSGVLLRRADADLRRLDQSNRLDWFASGTVIALLAGGAALIATAVAWQFVSPVPFAHPKALLRRNIWLPLVIVTLFEITSGATSLLIPNFLAALGRLKPEQSGLAL